VSRLGARGTPRQNRAEQGDAAGPGASAVAKDNPVPDAVPAAPRRARPRVGGGWGSSGSRNTGRAGQRRHEGASDTGPGAQGDPPPHAVPSAARPARSRAGGGWAGSGGSASGRSSSGSAAPRRRDGASDIRVQQAREHQDAADAARALAARHLAQRDHLVRSLYQEGGWSYSRLASTLGLTPELVAKIIRPHTR
jgi:hypothetical protein